MSGPNGSRVPDADRALVPEKPFQDVRHMIRDVRAIHGVFLPLVRKSIRRAAIPGALAHRPENRNRFLESTMRRFNRLERRASERTHGALGKLTAIRGRRYELPDFGQGRRRAFPTGCRIAFCASVRTTGRRRRSRLRLRARRQPVRFRRQPVSLAPRACAFY